MRRALAFLTPVGGAADPSVAALPWFPVVGALAGLLVGGVWWAGRRVWPAPAAAAVALLADAAVTGCLHLDGLADSADGLLAPMSRERRLVVLADPRTGAFGVVAVGLALLLRFAALDSVAPAPFVVAGLWSGSRAVAAVAAATLPYARAHGLASPFRRAPVPVVATTVLAGAVLAAGLAVAGRGPHGLAAVGAELAGAAVVLLFAHRRLGGFTGDVLGAAIVTAETAGLLTLAARW